MDWSADCGRQGDGNLEETVVSNGRHERPSAKLLTPEYWASISASLVPTERAGVSLQRSRDRDTAEHDRLWIARRSRSTPAHEPADGGDKDEDESEDEDDGDDNDEDADRIVNDMRELEEARVAAERAYERLGVRRLCCKVRLNSIPDKTAQRIDADQGSADCGEEGDGDDGDLPPREADRSLPIHRAASRTAEPYSALSHAPRRFLV